MRLLPFLLAGFFLSSFTLYAANSPAKSTVDAVKPAVITAKLDEVLNNQKEIIKQLAEIKQELLIVKARATR